MIARLEEQEPERVRLDPVLDASRRREQADREQQRGEHDHEEADAVDADDVADAERVDPRVVLDELERADVPGSKCQSRQTREAERRPTDAWRSRPPGELGAARRASSRHDDRADDGRHDERGEDREVAHRLPPRPRSAT